MKELMRDNSRALDSLVKGIEPQAYEAERLGPEVFLPKSRARRQTAVRALVEDEAKQTVSFVAEHAAAPKWHYKEYPLE